MRPCLKALFETILTLNASTKTRSFGVHLVRVPLLRLEDLKTDNVPVEHARLKDHVANMEGQLDAAIHEGGACDSWRLVSRWKSYNRHLT